MGREVRRVPPYWNHPNDSKGDPIPLHDGYTNAVADWDLAAAKWDDGFEESWKEYPKILWEPKHPDHTGTYAEWAGERPKESDYIPDFPEADRTHYQMYENTSEGTPISPVMPTAEDLARWLADNGASAFGNMTATYKQWLATIHAGSAPSMIMYINTGIQESGVAAMEKI